MRYCNNWVITLQLQSTFITKVHLGYNQLISVQVQEEECGGAYRETAVRQWRLLFYCMKGKQHDGKMHPEELRTAASAANTTSALCLHKQHANAKLAKLPEWC